MKVEYRKLYSSSAFAFREISVLTPDELANKKAKLFTEYGNNYLKTCSDRLTKELQRKPTAQEMIAFQKKCNCSLNKLSTDDDERNIRKSASDTIYFYFYDCENNTYNTMKNK